MGDVARVELDGQVFEFPIVVGTEGERAIDISALRKKTGYITLDDGYSNTGSCKSAITFIDGETGILRYRGIPIEELAERSSFIETAYLLIFGHLPNIEERAKFTESLTECSAIPQAMLKHFDGFPEFANPMAILSAMINALSTHERPKIGKENDDEALHYYAARLISKVRTLAAASYKSNIGEPITYPRHDLRYVDNFLHMMFSVPYKNYEASPEVSHALNMFLVLHADHEQNCSTSTVRMAASSNANMYASCAAGVVALWGDRHGGANVATIQMLQRLRREQVSVEDFVNQVKDKNNGIRLMGFGHRVYRNFDPRAKILKKAADDLLESLHISDPLLDVAKELEECALNDDYFISRKLYPNVDFYSGIILRAIGIPLNMFTVLFAIGRLPGWIANWKEVYTDPNGKIYRPRQVYVGNPITPWTPSRERQ